MVHRRFMASKIKTKLKFDITICGAGLAGLSLAYQAIKAGVWQNEEIVIVDKNSKTNNDRTWSFWKKADVNFEDLIFKRWNQLAVYSNTGEKLPLETGKYTYNSIRSIDFYNEAFNFLSACKNVRFYYEEILDVRSVGTSCYVDTASYQFVSTYVFNSLFKTPDLKTGAQYFLQHFKGVLIKSSLLNLNQDEATLMDFRTGQEQGTTFFYALPVKEDQLFLEYTIFSKELLKPYEYDRKIEVYIKDILKITEYEILSDEYGVIPMTDHRFVRFNGNIINIGTIGGDTRGATGYTFMNVQKTVSKIIEHWKLNNDPFYTDNVINKRHRIYDATLLNVLDSGRYPGNTLFIDLFKNTKASDVFAFLDGETSFKKDLSIIKSLKSLPFIKAMVKIIKNSF
jgi:lycopene beta-cyclase